jgi:hypothetical protein
MEQLKSQITIEREKCRVLQEANMEINAEREYVCGKLRETYPMFLEFRPLEPFPAIASADLAINDLERQLADARAEAEELRQAHASVERMLAQSRQAAVTVAEEQAATRRELIDQYGEVLGGKPKGKLLEEIAKLSDLQEGFAHIQAMLTREVQAERVQNVELVQTVKLLNTRLDAANERKMASERKMTEQERKLSAVDAELNQLRQQHEGHQASHDKTVERLAKASGALEEESAQLLLLQSAFVHEQELRAASELHATTLLCQINETKAELKRLGLEHDRDKSIIESELAALRRQLEEQARSTNAARSACTDLERQLIDTRAEAERWRHTCEVSATEARESQARAEETLAEDEQFRIELKQELLRVKELLRSTDGEQSMMARLQQELDVSNTKQWRLHQDLDESHTKHHQELVELSIARARKERELEHELEALQRRCGEESRSTTAARSACTDLERQLADTRAEAEELRRAHGLLISECAQLRADFLQLRSSQAITNAWDVDPAVRRLLDRMNDPAVCEALDRLISELRTKHSTVYEMLNRMDRNKDGILSRDEIRRGLAEMGVRLTATELDSVMRAFDKDHNGKIDYLEFYTVLTKRRVETAANQTDVTRRSELSESANRIDLPARAHAGLNLSSLGTPLLGELSRDISLRASASYSSRHVPLSPEFEDARPDHDAASSGGTMQGTNYAYKQRPHTQLALPPAYCPLPLPTVPARSEQSASALKSEMHVLVVCSCFEDGVEYIAKICTKVTA